MSRDPLEGYRPDDTSGLSLAPAPPASFSPPVSSLPVSSGSSTRGSGTKVIVLVIVATLFTVTAAVMAYFLTQPHAPLAPKAKPPGEMVVKQGPAPADDPPPTPIATPK
ncbi:MAG: hypothetical protein ABIQ43_07925 [Sphingomonas sp.]